jgi:hypothetical protein
MKAGARGKFKSFHEINYRLDEIKKRTILFERERKGKKRRSHRKSAFDQKLRTKSAVKSVWVEAFFTLALFLSTTHPLLFT